MDKVGAHEYLLPLDGQEIDGTKYKRLADYLGTTTLPDLNGRYMRADKTPNQMVDAGLPNITGLFTVRNGMNNDAIGILGDGGDGANGAFTLTTRNWTGSHSGFADASKQNKPIQVVNFNASRSNHIYGNSDTVTPLTYTVRAYIAYA